MTTATAAPQTTPANVTQNQIRSFRERGFVHIPGIITKEEAAEFREAALACQAKVKDFSQGNAVFTQLVNVWLEDDTMKRLSLHPNVAAVAEKINGVPTRLWHDQILIKQPKNARNTEFHQDLPYWPHVQSPNPISAWIALCDVPVERGCMTFIPGSHKWEGLQAQDLGNPRSLFEKAPDLEWVERVTVPLRAGDCTFHHGLCAHMATPNLTDEPRVAHVVIFTNESTIFDGRGHPCTDGLGLTVGQPLNHANFPRVTDIIGR